MRYVAIEFPIWNDLPSEQNDWNVTMQFKSDQKT